MVEKLAGKPRVLVLGVGTGRELSALQDAGHSPTGLDFSPEMLAICDRRTRRVPLVEADFWERLPFPEKSFDAAIALHGTLGHPPEDAESLDALARELARVLERPAVVVFEVPTLGMADLIPPTFETEDGRRMTREGTRLHHQDTVVGASIEARLLPTEIYVNAFNAAGFKTESHLQPNKTATLTAKLT